MASFGHLAAIDDLRRVLLDEVEIFLPLADAKLALARPPDFEDDVTVAWSSISPAEASAVAARESVLEDRRTLEAAFQNLFAVGGHGYITLYYCDPRNGE